MMTSEAKPFSEKELARKRRIVAEVPGMAGEYPRWLATLDAERSRHASELAAKDAEIARLNAGIEHVRDLAVADGDTLFIREANAVLTSRDPPHTVPARLDPDGSATGRTILTAPIVGNSASPASAHVDIETGKRTGLGAVEHLSWCNTRLPCDCGATAPEKRV